MLIEDIWQQNGASQSLECEAFIVCPSSRPVKAGVTLAWLLEPGRKWAKAKREVLLIKAETAGGF